MIFEGVENIKVFENNNDFFCLYNSMLFRMRLKDDKWQKLCDLPTNNSKILLDVQFNFVMLEKKLIFLEKCDSYLYIFDIDTCSLEKKSFSDKMGKAITLASVESINNGAIVITKDSDYLIAINNELECKLIDWKSVVRKKTGDNYKKIQALRYNCSDYDTNSIWLSVKTSEKDAYIKFDANSFEVLNFLWPNTIGITQGIFELNGYLWRLLLDNGILRLSGLNLKNNSDDNVIFLDHIEKSKRCFLKKEKELLFIYSMEGDLLSLETTSWSVVSKKRICGKPQCISICESVEQVVWVDYAQNEIQITSFDNADRVKGVKLPYKSMLECFITNLT